MFKKLLVATLSGLIFLSTSVLAVGLGEIKQSSGLNQPLKAEIKLLSPGDLAEYEVVASIASQSAFDKSGIDKPFFLNKIKFKTVKNSRGELVIKVSTHEPVKEPFLNFLIELNTPAQQFYREYTLLLDPPIFEEATSSTIEKTKSEKSPPPDRSVNHSKQRNAEPSAPSSRYNESNNADDSDGQNYNGSQYGPVSSTDTLWSIASKVRPSRNVSIQQTLVAIYRANPSAFSNGNINNLLKGKVLDIPSEAAIQNVPQRAALQDVVMQNRQWRSGGARNIVDQTDGHQSNNSSQNRGSRLSLATADAEGNAEGYGADTAELNDLQDQLVRTQEESATLKAENDELKARLAEILKNAERAKNKDGLGVNVEDNELALLGQKAQEKSNEQSSEESNEQSSEQSDDSLENEMNAEEQSLNDNPQSESKDAKPVTDSTDNKVDSKPKAPIKAATKPKEKSMLDTILDSSTLLWGGIATFVLIIMILVFWRMKKRMEDDSFQDDLVASTGAGSMDTTEMFELPDVGDDMLVELEMDDEDESEQQGDGEAFDPLGEADIYIAYGKIDQAETLLLEAIEENPIRSDYKVKLMECYAESDNKEGFDKLEDEVKEAVDADEWSEQIALLKSKAWEGESSEEDDEFDLPSTEDIFGDDNDDDNFDIDLSSESTDETLQADDEFGLDHENDDDSELNEEFLESDGELDDLDSLEDIDDLDSLDDLGSLDNQHDSGDELSIDDDDIDLDSLDEIDSLDDLDSLNDLDISDDETSSDEVDDLNFDSLDELENIDSVDDELSIDIEDDKEVSLDIDNDFEFDEEGDENIDFGETLSDEIATKLDLARAYVDMGDLEGAKEILTEVIEDGTDKQKSEAQELIDKC